jgi:hypothetical protein
VRDVKRTDFASRLAKRFLPRAAAGAGADAAEGSSLKPCNVLGVDYLVGRCESTGGTLWVVGNDPALFAYLLPERWRVKHAKLSRNGETYYAETKDRLEVVWKVSRVGELPPGRMDDPGYKQVLMQGINSPFEEVSLALALSRAGVHVTAPLAIYVTPDLPEAGGVVLDERRFEQMSRLSDPDGRPVLPIDHDFIIVWSYWRGAADGPQVWTPINAADARAKGLISDGVFDHVLARHGAQLAAAGIEPPRLWPEHVLLAYIPSGDVLRDGAGRPVTCHCSFETMRQARAIAACDAPPKCASASTTLGT